MVLSVRSTCSDILSILSACFAFCDFILSLFLFILSCLLFFCSSVFAFDSLAFLRSAWAFSHGFLAFTSNNFAFFFCRDAAKLLGMVLLWLHIFAASRFARFAWYIL